jgi:hypothetical protein
VAVCVDDIPCACSPLVLHVYPGPCETSRAAIRGDALIRRASRRPRDCHRSDGG